MRKVRKIMVIGMCGLTMGGIMSVFGAEQASGRIYSTCDQKVDAMEKQAARDYKKGKLSEEDYAKVQAEVLLHRTLWGC